MIGAKWWGWIGVALATISGASVLTAEAQAELPCVSVGVP